jgi:diacylglycerol kinase family enzyme
VAALFPAFLIKRPEVAVLCSWIALSLLLVGLAYLFNSPKVLGKRPNGVIPWYSRCLLGPFFLGAHLYNAFVKQRDEVPSIQRIDDYIFLGNRISPSDFSQLDQTEINAVLDVTAEFDATDWGCYNSEIEYLNIPILDQSVPTREQCQQAVAWIHNHVRQHKSVFIHCALGRGRSVFILAAYFSLAGGSNPAEVVERIQHTRGTVRLNSKQISMLQKYVEEGSLFLPTRAWIVANPSAGGGKWETTRDTIVNLLSSRFQLTVKTTTREISADELTRQAVEDGAAIVIACGGDGTVNEVASRLVDTDIKLGVIPLGTANAFIHAVCGLQSKVGSVESACEGILAGRARRVDTARCNGKTVLLLVGVGFEQAMIEAADRSLKDKFGQIAYIKSLWNAINQNEALSLNVRMDDEAPREIKAGSMVVANAAPITTLLAQGHGQPDLSDGSLDVTWLEYTDGVGDNLLSILELAVSGITRESLNQLVNHTLARRVRLTAESSLKYVIDGEMFEDDAVDIQIRP